MNFNLRNLFFTFSSLILIPAGLISAELPVSATPANTANYSEIPYYLRKLEETKLEGERLRLNKIIHDAVVNTNISDKKTVKKMEPIIFKIQMAMDSGLDRPYIEGQSMWLASAVDHFERGKLKTIVSIPSSDWGSPQTESPAGLRISTFPDKILLHKGSQTTTIVESSQIYEAVISPQGTRVAFGRQTNNESKAEIWVVNLKNLKRNKIGTLSSFHTILFSRDGKLIFVQEMPKDSASESILRSVSAGGGSFKPLTKIRLLETVIAKGPHRGDLIVYKRTRHHLGLAEQDCAFVIDKNGKEVGRLKDGPCR